MTLSATLDMSEAQRILLTGTIERYGGQLLRFIRTKINKLEDAEDVLQDVWYQLSKATHIDELENISAWLHAVTRNKITDYYRKKKINYLEDFIYETEDGEINIQEILLLDDSNDADLALFKELFWKELMLALDELPENQRSVFIRNEIEDMTLQEIAAMDNENIKTITSRKGYAVKHLRKRLQYLYDELFY